MPTRFEFNTTTVVMNNPALRVADKSYVLDEEVKEKYYDDLEEYKTSEVTLPAIWSRKTVNRPNHRCIIDNCVRQPPRSELYSYREVTPYFPYCEALFNIATTEQKCDWIHGVHLADLKDETYIYNFPCGCNNPTMENTADLRRTHRIALSTWHSTSAVVLPNVRTEEGMKLYNTVGWFEVPKCQVFRKASPSKRVKKRKALSLTDHRSYRKLLRSRRTARCSSLLQNEEDDDSDGWGTSSP